MNSESTSHDPKIINIGPFKLKPLAQNLSFKAKEELTPEQQILIDYIWNAHNKSQLTMSIHAMTYYLHKETKKTQKPLSQNITQIPKLTPDPPPQQLMNFIRELEYSNTELRMKSEKMEEIKKENIKLRAEILRKEKEEEEAWGAWKKFPSKINEAKQEVLQIVTENYAREQHDYQELFRRMAQEEKSLPGISFITETYDDGMSNHKGCSYASCNISLKEWKDQTVGGLHLSLDKFIKMGLINRLYVSEKKELIRILAEKLMLSIASMMENKQTTIECEFQTIPPAFKPGEICSAKSYISLRRVPSSSIQHIPVNYEEIIPDELCSLEDQISQFRALRLNKPYAVPPTYELIAEDRDMKIYAKDLVSSLNSNYQFSGVHVKNIKLAHYYHQVRAYYMTKLQGDVWRNHEEDDSESDALNISVQNDDHDSVTEANIINQMET